MRETPDTFRSERLALGLTQGQAARLVGVRARTWRDWEARGSVPVPVRRIMRVMALVPGVQAALQIMADDEPGDAA